MWTADMLSETTKKAILDLQKKYPERRSALIPALHLAQAEKGYLPTEIQAEVAALFDLDQNEVNSIVSFYDMFFEEPVGKHIIHVCKNVSCMLRGADGVLNGLCKRLGVKPGGTSADGQFTVIASECLAACDRAPMMLVDDKVVGPVREDQLDRIITEAEQTAGHPCPVPMQEVTHG
jgi:NADH-quinone oxidoreductase subunit E